MSRIGKETSLQPDSQKSNSRYKQLKISANPAIVFAFKTACAASEVSMAAVLTQFMTKYTNITAPLKPAPVSPSYTTRKQRREAIYFIVRQLEQIRNSEEDYRDRIPENLQASTVYARADELVTILDEVIDLLAQV